MCGKREGRTSKRIDIIEIKRSLEGSAPCGIGHDGALDPSDVTGLGGEDGTGSGEVCRVGDVLSSTEVGSDADTFEDGGEGGKGLGIGVGEGVRAGLCC